MSISVFPSALSSRAGDCFISAWDQGLAADGASTAWTIMESSTTVVHSMQQHPYAAFIDLEFTSVNDYKWKFNKPGFYKGTMSLAMICSTLVTGGNLAFQMGINGAADNAKCPVTTARWLAANQIEDVHLAFAGNFKKGDYFAPGTLFDTGGDTYVSVDASLQVEYYRE